MTPDRDADATRASLFLRLFDPGASDAAWREFVGRYRPRIADWCRRNGLQESDADDITQDVLCKLVVRLKTFAYDPARGFRAYLRRLVDNAIRDWRSGRARRPGAQGSGDSGVAGLLEGLPDARALAELTADLSGLLESDSLEGLAVKRVRAKVEPHTWSAFWQTACEGRPAEEVAARLGLRVASVYQARRRVNNMLKRARQELRGREGAGEEGTS